MAKTRRFIYGRNRQLVFLRIFFDLTKFLLFFCFFWISEWITETQPRTRIFSYEEKTANIASANCFSSILRNEVCFFFFIFFLFNLTGDDTFDTTIWRFFFRRISAWIHEATGSSFFGAKNWTSFSQLKHHNWPPIFLLEEQGIVPRNGPMLLPQPKIWYKEKIIRNLKKLSNVYGNFPKTIPTDYVQVNNQVFFLSTNTCVLTEVAEVLSWIGIW